MKPAPPVTKIVELLTRMILVCLQAVDKAYQIGELKVRTIEALRRALESAGVEFIDENGGGPAVRLRKLGKS